MINGSEDFRRFRESYFGSRGYGWEPDVRALLRLQSEERAAAETMLLAELQRGDSEAACGLGELRSVRAVEALKKSLSAADASLRVQSAVALWKIERFPKAAMIISAGLSRTSAADPVDDEEIDNLLLEFDLVECVMALGEIATPESAAALVKALSHPRDLVRYNAARAIGSLCGQSREIAQLQSALMSNDPKASGAARESILALIDPGNIQDIGGGVFTIHFDWTGHEYLVYEEGGYTFHFHPDYAQEPILVPTGDYLSGILGNARDFQLGERERIVPRLQKFLGREHSQFAISPAKHLPEPDELVPSLGGKIRFKTMTVAAHAQEPDEEEVFIPKWRLALVLFIGLGLGGGAGWAVGRFAVLMLDFRPFTAWICVGLGGVIGAVLAWLGRARG